jgi:DNA-3-methyladenine glycosylase
MVASNAAKKIAASYFQSDDTLGISQGLLGKFLVSMCGNQRTSGMIIETEAYLGKGDRASHAYGGRRTKRTEVMYLPGGHWYVYLCYGLHCLLNIVTHRKEEPHAILIRAIAPCEGIETMLKRREKAKVDLHLTSGPGSLCKALGIGLELSGEPLGKKVWIEDWGILIPKDQIVASPRIGVSYAKEHALLPYRFNLLNPELPGSLQKR